MDYRRINVLQKQKSLQRAIQLLLYYPRNGGRVIGSRKIDDQHRNERRKAHHIQSVAVKCHCEAFQSKDGTKLIGNSPKRVFAHIPISGV